MKNVQDLKHKIKNQDSNKGYQKKNTMEREAEFHFTWVLVLWTGLIIFQGIEGMKNHFLGRAALLCYLTGTLYFSISSLPLFVTYVLDKLPLIKNNEDAENINSQ